MQMRRLRGGNEGWLTSYADLITNLLIFFILIISASQIQSGKMEKIIQSISENRHPESLTSAAEKLNKELAEQHLKENVRVEIQDDGLALSFDSGVLFNSGSADIMQIMESPLSAVLLVLKPYTEKYAVAVEGHTDERPIKTGVYKSNWELSSARAMRIRERLESNGVDPHRIRVEAYADNKALPADVTKGLDNERRLAKHRRVVVRLY